MLQVSEPYINPEGKAVLAMLSNPKITNGDNFYEERHHKELDEAAWRISNRVYPK